MAELLTSNVVGTLHVTGSSFANGSPTSNTSTQVFTGLCAVKTANTTLNSSTLAADGTLMMVLNEIGVYSIEGYISFYESTLGTGGFQFDVAAGNVGANWINWTASGFNSAVVGNTSSVALNSGFGYATISTSATAPSWISISGTVSTSNVGTFGIRTAQANTFAADVTNVLRGSQLSLVKIG